jgi:hypothetical protein
MPTAKQKPEPERKQSVAALVMNAQACFETEDTAKGEMKDAREEAREYLGELLILFDKDAGQFSGFNSIEQFFAKIFPTKDANYVLKEAKKGKADIEKGEKTDRAAEKAAQAKRTKESRERAEREKVKSPAEQMGLSIDDFLSTFGSSESVLKKLRKYATDLAMARNNLGGSLEPITINPRGKAKVTVTPENFKHAATAEVIPLRPAPVETPPASPPVAETPPAPASAAPPVASTAPAATAAPPAASAPVAPSPAPPAAATVAAPGLDHTIAPAALVAKWIIGGNVSLQFAEECRKQGFKEAVRFIQGLSKTEWEAAMVMVTRGAI